MTHRAALLLNGTVHRRDSPCYVQDERAGGLPVRASTGDPSPREVLAIAAGEHDYGPGRDEVHINDRLTEADVLLQALRSFGYRVVRNGEHLLHQNADRWSMEHTVDCRERGLSRCELGTLAVDQYWLELPPGTYRLTWPEADEWPTAEPVSS